MPSAASRRPYDPGRGRDVLPCALPRRPYAVKGKLGKGEDLVPGTMLDLKSMRDAGEEIYNIPVSDEEMKNVVESVYGELPEVE